MVEWDVVKYHVLGWDVWNTMLFNVRYVVGWDVVNYNIVG